MKEEYIESFKKLGAELAGRRTASAISREELERRTKIQTHYLQAIEEGRLDLLPQGFYRKNFVREYCAQIGANSLFNEYSKLFAAIEEEDKSVSAAIFHEPTGKNLLQDKEYKPLNSKPLIIAAAILLIVAGALVVMFSGTIKSGAQKADVTQLKGGTATVLEQKKEEEKKKQQAAEEKASKLSEARAKAEEAEYAGANGTAQNGQAEGQMSNQTEETAELPAAEQLAKNELYIYAPKQKIKIKVSFKDSVIYMGELGTGKAMRFKVEEKNSPLRVRYENPNLTEVSFAGVEFKPLHPKSEGRSRYYWSDGTITFTPKKN